MLSQKTILTVLDEELKPFLPEIATEIREFIKSQYSEDEETPTNKSAFKTIVKNWVREIGTELSEKIIEDNEELEITL